MSNFSVGVLVKVAKDQLTGWIKKARDSLSGLSSEARAAGNAVDEGLSKGADGARSMRDGIASISDQLRNLKNAAIGFLAISQTLQQATALSRLTDEYQSLIGRLRIAIGEHGDLDAAMESVRDVANATGADLSATAALYARLAQASGQLGLSQREIAGITETVSQAFVVSGASAAEASNGIRQLSQALASGVLRGDEFNSIMENAPRLARALSDSLGVTTGELRRMAEAGQLSAKTVVDALQSQAAAIEADFGQMPETVGRATQRLVNEWTRFVGELDQSTGASANVAAALNSVADNLDKVTAAATLAGQAVLAGLIGKAGAALLAYGKHLMAAKAAAGILAAETVAKTGVIAQAWAGVATAIRSIPTSVKIGIAYIGLEAAAAAARWLGESIARLTPAVKEAEAAQRQHNEAMAQAAGDAANSAMAMSHYRDVAIRARDEVLRLSESERARYEAGLQKSREYWLAVSKEQQALLEISTLTEAQRKQAEEAGAEAGERLAAIRAALTDVQDAAGLTREALANLMDPKAAVLVADFTRQVQDLQSKGTPAAEAVAKALAEMTKTLQPSSVESVRVFGQALEDLASKGTIAARQVEDSWGQAIARMGGEDLRKFAITAEAAFADGERGAKAMATTMDQVLRRAIANAGADFDLITHGVSKAANDAIQNFELIEEHLEALGRKGADTGKALAAGIASGLKRADSLDALRYWDDKIRQLAAKGALSMGQLKAATQAANEAFLQYAQDAFAANGGVVDGTLRAAAEMRGYTTVVDEHGKLHLRRWSEILTATKEVESATRDAADAQREMTQALSGQAGVASKAAEVFGPIATTSAELYRQKIREGMQAQQDYRKSIDDVAEAMHKLHGRVYAFSADGIRRYEQLTQQAYDYGRALARIEKEASVAAEAVRSGTLSVGDAMDVANSLAQMLGAHTSNARLAIDALGGEELRPLRDAIEDAQRRMRELRDDAADTLSGIQDEWDSLNNNLDQIEMRRYQKRRAEVEARLELAKQAGDKQAIADLERSLALLKQIAIARVADARKRDEEAKARAREEAKQQPPAAAKPAQSSSHVVTIKLPSGQTSQVKTASAGDAANLVSLLNRLQTDMARAA